MDQLMLATSNPGKASELRALFSADSVLRNVTLLTPQDWPEPLPAVEETGASFEENALLKARSLAKVTGLPALADDSGLCVDALGGAPGLHSARWAGAFASDADRNERLLEALSGVSDERRTAQFICAIAVAAPEGRTLVTVGRCEGLILCVLRGEAGFGYDPLFFLPEVGRTMAELTPSEKNLLSHRGRAIASLLPRLREMFPAPEI